jgi:hypothetical protein
VEESHTSGYILHAFNVIFITLIPKDCEANMTNKFRPISLCNVLYKIITKVIANRLNTITNKIVSLEQGGFVEGRQILDGIIVAREKIHSLITNK